MIKGAVPGSKGGWVTVKDAVKKAAIDGIPFPAALRTNADETANQDAKETPSEPVSEPITEETSANGGEE
jgi:large subunit ribosomal protein L3